MEEEAEALTCNILLLEGQRKERTPMGTFREALDGRGRRSKVKVVVRGLEKR